MIRYANDLLLTELARQITLEVASMNEYLRDGNLEAAFLRAHTMGSQLQSLMARLNEIKYGSDDKLRTVYLDSLEGR